MNHPLLKVGLIGLGKMGAYHLEKLQAQRGIDLVAVFDSDEEKRNRVSKIAEVHAAGTVEELFFMSEAVWIASPTHSHYALAKAALMQGLHVFVEKPLCDNLADSQELVALAQEKGLVLQVGFLERHRLYWALSQYGLGMVPVLIEAERFSTAPAREKGTDVVQDLMIHDIDLVLWLMGEDPVSVSAAGSSVGISQIDIANARLEFSSGSIANLRTNWVASERRRQIDLIAPSQIVSIDLLNTRIRTFSRGIEGEAEALPEAVFDALRQQCQSFLSAVQQKGKPFVSGQDAARAQEVAEKIRSQILRRNEEFFTEHAPVFPLAEREEQKS